jgi:hypothetical protein
MREHLDYTPQKPEREQEAILDWQSRKVPWIAGEAQARSAHSAFLDESGLLLTPNARQAWAPRGRNPILETRERPRNHRRPRGGNEVSECGR